MAITFPMQYEHIKYENKDFMSQNEKKINPNFVWLKVHVALS